jgi:dynein heavy chain
MKLDEPWDSKLDIFERAMVLKIFRSEKVLFALGNYVMHYLGKYYLEPPKTTMEILYNDSDVAMPIIFVLSQGADPTSQILRFARERDFESKLSIISLGQG